jgi:pyruvate dehydrogenase E2 component (dihydrolipoamide acetyltransferase)
MTHESPSVPIFLPSFGASIEEGTIVSWKVSVGETVHAGQVIAEIETEKATVELEATEDGVIEAIEIPEGGPAVPVGTTIARLTTSSPAADTAEPTGERASDTGHVTEAPVSATSTDHPTTATTSASDPTSTAASAPRTPGLPEEALSTPRSRRLARMRGEKVPDTPEADSNSSTDPETPRTAPSTPAKTSSASLFAPGTYDVVPLTGMRKAIARRLSASFRDVPHFSLSVDVEMDPVMRHRQAANETGPTGSIKLSINDFVVWAAAAALKDVPEANSSYTDAGMLRHHHANIAVAVAIGGGLVAPVVRAAETKSLEEIAAETRRLTEKARARHLGQEELEGGTFTVSNLGMAGITSFTSVLNPPQGCILSVGAAEQRPVVRQGEIAVATVATMTLTCDHRAVDGVIGAEFLSALKTHLATPPSG